MSKLPTPLNNNVLVEILDEFEGVLRDDSEERTQKGRVIDLNITSPHLTASSAMEFVDPGVMFKALRFIIGKIVYWQEYADSGQTFERDGKKYALVPWWRLTAVEKER